MSAKLCGMIGYVTRDPTTPVSTLWCECIVHGGSW